MIANIGTRFREIIDTDKVSMKIDIVGAGTTGSNLVLLLARLGLQDITVYDFDDVEDHNLGHQMYRVKDIGKPKLEALKDLVKEATDVDIKIVHGETDGKNIDTDILVLALDTMSGRKEIVENARHSFVVDSRIGGEVLMVYATMDKARHKATLYSDEEAAPETCGSRSIGYTAFMVAALMEIVIKKIMLGEEFPFEQEFCAKNLIYNVKY